MKASATPEYHAYKGAKLRCNNPRNKNYKDYGGRGIEMRFQNFNEFLSHLGRKPSPRHSLDRIDNNGHYEIGNVRWATRGEQAHNRRKAAPRALMSHCRRGHPLSGDNLYIAALPGRGIVRQCRACNLLAAVRLKERKAKSQS